MGLTDNFGKRLRELRRSRNLTQADLAEMVGLDTMSISRMENGARFPQAANIEKIAKALKCEVQEFFKFNYIKSEEELRADITEKISKFEMRDLKYFNKVIDAYFESKK